MKVYPENKKHDLCVISIENQFLVSFSLDPALYYTTPRHNPGSDFKKKMVLNRLQGLKKKSQEVSARKNNNWLRYNKKCWGGIPPPALLESSGAVSIDDVLVFTRNSFCTTIPQHTEKWNWRNVLWEDPDVFPGLHPVLSSYLVNWGFMDGR